MQGRARIVLADRDEQAGRSAVRQIEAAGAPDVIALACDVGVEEQVESAVTRTIDRFGQFDVIVNNAGVMIFKPLVELTRDDWMWVLTVDLLGAFFFPEARRAAHEVGRRDRQCVQCPCRRNHGSRCTYAAAKAALLSLTWSAALETKDNGIQVNAAVPGAVDTPMLWGRPKSQERGGAA